jgi:hypothetical protein
MIPALMALLSVYLLLVPKTHVIAFLKKLQFSLYSYFNSLTPIKIDIQVVTHLPSTRKVAGSNS